MISTIVVELRQKDFSHMTLLSSEGVLRNITSFVCFSLYDFFAVQISEISFDRMFTPVVSERNQERKGLLLTVGCFPT